MQREARCNVSWPNQAMRGQQAGYQGQLVCLRNLCLCVNLLQFRPIIQAASRKIKQIHKLKQGWAEPDRTVIFGTGPDSGTGAALRQDPDRTGPDPIFCPEPDWTGLSLGEWWPPFWNRTGPDRIFSGTGPDRIFRTGSFLEPNRTGLDRNIPDVSN